jgi:hypothetical protein
MSEIQQAPEAMMRGIFSLYETPEGGYKLVYRVNGEDQDRPHIDLPPGMVRMAKMMGEGNGKIRSIVGGMSKGG